MRSAIELNGRSGVTHSAAIDPVFEVTAISSEDGRIDYPYYWTSTTHISDNGMGIEEENLIKIFRHGFTTKKNGNGFGLHSGALAAKEMGGALFVHSDGSGKGATFTLELPFKPAAAMAAT